MAVVDRLILRLAVFEFLHQPGHAADGGHRRGARTGAHVQRTGRGAVRQRRPRRHPPHHARRTERPTHERRPRPPSAAPRQPGRARAARRRRCTRARSSAPTPSSALVAAHGERHGRRARGAAARDDHRRAHPRDPQLRQGELPGALRRPRAHPGLHPAGRAAGARLRGVQAARPRRLRRRQRARVPDQDERAHDLGVGPHVPREVPAPAAGEVARPAGRRDPVPPALPRPHRQPGLAARVRGAQRGCWRRSGGSSTRAGSSRSRRR